MKRVLVFILVFVSVVVFSQERGRVLYREKALPSPLPEEMDGIYRLDTLLVDYWEINPGFISIKPIMVGYKDVCRMYPKSDIPSVDDAVGYAWSFFHGNYSPEYYDNYFLRVFVSKE